MSLAQSVCKDTVTSIVPSSDKQEIFIQTIFAGSSYFFRMKIKYQIDKVEGADNIHCITAEHDDLDASDLTSIVMANDKFRKVDMIDSTDQTVIHEINIQGRVVLSMVAHHDSQTLFAVMSDGSSNFGNLYAFNLRD